MEIEDCWDIRKFYESLDVHSSGVSEPISKSKISMDLVLCYRNKRRGRDFEEKLEWKKNGSKVQSHFLSHPNVNQPYACRTSSA